MKKNAIVILILSIAIGCESRNVDFPVLKGPYLGQKPPGMKAEIFAPGFISTGAHEGLAALFTKNTFLFHRLDVDNTDWKYIPILETALKNGRWTKPKQVTFQMGHEDDNFTLAPDGVTLYFDSKRAPDGSSKSTDEHNIWSVKKMSDGWTQPKMLGPGVNASNAGEFYPSVTLDGTVYFLSNRENGLGGLDLYRSQYQNGQYQKAELLGSPPNTEHNEMDSFISADESFLLLSSKTLGGFGDYDLFVIFRKADASWSAPLNLGENVNSESAELRPSITPDGKYLFFSSNQNGNGDIYWVNAKIIEELSNRFTLYKK